MLKRLHIEVFLYVKILELYCKKWYNLNIDIDYCSWEGFAMSKDSLMAHVEDVKGRFSEIRDAVKMFAFTKHNDYRNNKYNKDTKYPEYSRNELSHSAADHLASKFYKHIENAKLNASMQELKQCREIMKYSGLLYKTSTKMVDSICMEMSQGSYIDQEFRKELFSKTNTFIDNISKNNITFVTVRRSPKSGATKGKIESGWTINEEKTLRSIEKGRVIVTKGNQQKSISLTEFEKYNPNLFRHQR